MFDLLDKLASKGLKLFGIALVGLIVIAFIANAFDDTPPEVLDAKDRLFMGYHDAKIYENTSCRTGQFGDDWVVLCERTGGQSNQGIYEIKITDEGKYKIYAVNGSGKTHAGRMGMYIDFNSQSSVDIEEVKNNLG